MSKRYSRSLLRATHNLRKLIQFPPFQRVNAELEKQVAWLKEEYARQQVKIAEWEAYGIEVSNKEKEWSKAWGDEKNTRFQLITSLLTGSGYIKEKWPVMEQGIAELQEPSILLAKVNYVTALKMFESINEWNTDRNSILCAAFIVGVRAYEFVHSTHGSDEDKRAFLSTIIDWLAARSKYAEFSHSGLETRFDAERHIRIERRSGDHVTPLSFLVRDRNSEHIIYKAWVK